MGILRSASLRDGWPQDGAGGGNPDRVLLAEDRAVRREAVDRRRVLALRLQVRLRRDHRARTPCVQVRLKTKEKEDIFKVSLGPTSPV